MLGESGNEKLTEQRMPTLVHRPVGSAAFMVVST